jgi:hypothetical protein
MKPRTTVVGSAFLLLLAGLLQAGTWRSLEEEFQRPPVSARPWAYWFFMDGNLSREGITADLEAMQRVGLGGMLIMEVDVGVPRGPVRFMSSPWKSLFKHAVTEAERLGLEITLNAGPGWTGSGGPWVKPEESMQHLVAASIQVTGPTNLSATLPQPAPRARHTVHSAMPGDLEKAMQGFYRDVAVLAFPTPAGAATVADLDEKALYYRNPYSSVPGVRPWLPAPASHLVLPPQEVVGRASVTDLTRLLQPDGRLDWEVPPGPWTLVRFGRTSTGANTRPAPEPGLGLESDKFDRRALEHHFENFVGALLREIGPRPAGRTSGWTSLHIDSWEMGAQNWTASFAGEFKRRRGYDALPYLPVMAGRVVENMEVSERFLWDVRQTAQELVLENHAGHLKTLGQRHGFRLSIEPYDMNPCSDLALGGVADVPMCEFWADGYGFNSSFSCIESVSISHTMGRPVVAAEAFTADAPEAWRLYPGRMKNQADWALCAGINRLVFHRYAHQPWLDRVPGMTMGPYGVHYERTQTWWEMTPAWHDYLARCQHLLRQGLPVADILYLAAEGAPHVFRPPTSATQGRQPMPDRRGYNFDGCAPDALLSRADVKDGRIVFPDGMSYRLLVLPEVETMTPALLGKINVLVRAGATVLGPRPLKSPSLSDYPKSDQKIVPLADGLWGRGTTRAQAVDRKVGRGRVVSFSQSPEREPSQLEPVRLPPPARWIWHPEGRPAASAPVGSRQFRREFVWTPGAPIESAWLGMTADNGFSATLNGEPAGQGDNFNRLYTREISTLLKPGTNVLAIIAENGGATPNPAGLIGVLEIRRTDGSRQIIATDRSWESRASDGGPWGPSLELGPLGMSPWSQAAKAGIVEQNFDLYPPYERTAQILAGMGAQPDFDSSIPLRYTHRRLKEADIYFVSNPEDRVVESPCAFRVVGKTPTLWDALSGRVHSAPSSESKDGRNHMKLRLEPHGSVFVVFRSSSARITLPPAPSSLLYAAVSEVKGPWKVRFQPGRGAPDHLELDQLGDLAKHPDSGVRYFSGIATYSATFDLTQVSAAKFLDLGDVEVMARVRLNGQDLGTVWTTPFRVEITGAATTGLNTLEIEVANLWPNRLIGDKTVSADQRVCWTTWNRYRKEDPLPASGLIGPVTLRRSPPGAAD